MGVKRRDNDVQPPDKKVMTVKNGSAQSPGLLCMMPPSAKMVVAVM